MNIKTNSDLFNTIKSLRSRVAVEKNINIYIEKKYNKELHKVTGDLVSWVPTV